MREVTHMKTPNNKRKGQLRKGTTLQPVKSATGDIDQDETKYAEVTATPKPSNND